MAVREVEPGHVHFPQCNGSSERPPAPLCPCQHGGTKVDPDDLRTGRIERDVAASSNAGIEKRARKTLEQFGSDTTIPSMLERSVEQVIERCDPLVAVQGR